MRFADLMDPEVRDENWRWLQSDATERLNQVLSLLYALRKHSKGVPAEEIKKLDSMAKNLCKRHNRQNLNVAVMALMKSGTPSVIGTKSLTCSSSAHCSVCF